jgi:hypothetical protein
VTNTGRTLLSVASAITSFWRIIGPIRVSPSILDTPFNAPMRLISTRMNGWLIRSASSGIKV